MSGSLKSCLPCVELLGYIVTNFSFSTAFAPDAKPLTSYCREDIQRHVAFMQNEEDSSVIRLDLDLSVSEESKKEYAYDWKLSISGLFKGAIPLEDQNEEDTAITFTSCSSLLYSSAREYLRSATSIGAAGAILLPTTSFVESPRDKDTEE